jgi:hypothetical protein
MTRIQPYQTIKSALLAVSAKQNKTTDPLPNGTEAEHHPASATAGRRLRKGLNNDQTSLVSHEFTGYSTC